MATPDSYRSVCERFDVSQSSALTPVITISDLKDIYNPEKSHLVEYLKNKLNKIIIEKEWEFSDVVEHNYSKAEGKDCLIYYLTGYLSKQLLKYVEGFDTCKSTFVIPQIYSQQLSATLLNMRTKGRLIHPNIVFFNIIKQIEESFSNIVHPQKFLN